jgi:Cu/Ag efflux protein CusF
MSKKISVATVLAGVVLASTAVLAATETKTGEIKSTDASKKEIVLSSGDTFELGSNVKLDKLKVGEKVTVTYETKDGKMLASKVHAAK